jgi:hypothetical protein
MMSKPVQIIAERWPLLQEGQCRDDANPIVILALTHACRFPP